MITQPLFWHINKATGPAFSPLDLSPSLWLDAFDTDTLTLDGSNVVSWGDKSGNATDFSQSTPAQRLTYSASGPNGHPALIGGAGLNMSGAVSLAQPNTIIGLVGFSAHGLTGQRMLDSTTGRQLIQADATTMSIFAGSFSGGISRPDNAAGAFVATFDGASSAQRIDEINGATVEETGQSISTGGITSVLFIGGTGGSLSWLGSFSELIIVPRVLSGEEITATLSYLTARA